MEKYSFFNSVVDEAGNYDREYLAEDYANYFASFIGNGIYAKSASNLQVTAAGNMVVQVSAGKAWINGYFYENTTAKSLSLDLADGTTERIDRIVLRLDLVNRQITAEVKKGAASTTAVAPDIQRDANIYELVLADILVGKNAIEVTQANVTDQRFNTSVCGVVAGVVEQIDTEGLFAEYESAFNEWFDTIKSQLSGDIATNLQAQIGNLEELSTENKENLTGAVNEVKENVESVADAVEVVNSDIDNFKTAVFDMIYPVGSIYMSVNSANPTTMFGGTWVAWGAGRVPVGVNASDTDFASVEKTGGNKELQSHNHGFTPSGTIAETTATGTISNTTAGGSISNTTSTMQSGGSHSHYLTWEKDGKSGTDTNRVFANGAGGSRGTAPGALAAGAHTHTMNAHNHTFTGTAHNHTFTGTAHKHTFSGSAGTTNSSGSGDAKNLQPYITCYMWKRTA